MGDLTWLTNKDVQTLKSKIVLTEDEEQMLEFLRKGRFTDEGIMLEMNLSRNKFYKIKGKLEDKIIKAAVQS